MRVWKDLEVVLPEGGFSWPGRLLSSFQAGKKGLEMNRDAVSDADGGPFRASQGGGGDGWMITPF